MHQSVGPYTIIRLNNQFHVRQDRTTISVYRNYQDAEDAALRYWLDHPDEEDNESVKAASDQQ
jgi:hypothetical protein